MMKSEVCVVTVTYGDRFHLLSQVIRAASEQGATRIIVVDNDSNGSSRQKLQELEKSQGHAIRVVQLPENTGPDNGFKVGLQEAYKCDRTEFIWLLDDDNKPRENALHELLKFWYKFELANKKRRLCLASLREAFLTFKNAVTTNDPALPVAPRNSFRNFHVLHLYKKFLKRKPLTENRDANNKPFGELFVAPYGGMFFHKDLLSAVGYPDDRFFIYTGDYDFSHRIIKAGGKILLLLNSVVEDLDRSWHTKMSGPDFFKLAAIENDFRLYYDVRNRIFFEFHELCDNKVMYCLNVLVFSVLFTLSACALMSFDKIPLYFVAICDGFKGRLGKNENFTI